MFHCQLKGIVPKVYCSHYNVGSIFPAEFNNCHAILYDGSGINFESANFDCQQK